MTQTSSGQAFGLIEKGCIYIELSMSTSTLLLIGLMALKSGEISPMSSLCAAEYTTCSTFLLAPGREALYSKVLPLESLKL